MCIRDRYSISDLRKGGVLAEISTSLALPLRMFLRALFRPSETLPDFITSCSFELMLSWLDFLVFV